MKLSIITTLYKSEPYIRKCLDSLLQQDLSYSDYELVIVDDGSPDNCVSIIKEEYQTKYPNIVLVSQVNMGLPEARNTGLRNVSGTYVTFVDPDDYVQPNVYGKLLEKIQQEDLDALRHNYTLIEEKSYKVLPKFKESLLTVDYQDNIVDGETFLGERLGVACYVWQFIFKSSLFKDNNIYFREKVFDDADLLPRILMKANKVTSLDIHVYNYLLREGSLVNVLTKTAAIKKIEGFFFIINVYNECFTQAHNEKVKLWFRSMVSVSFLGILQTVAQHDFENRTKHIKRFRALNKLKFSTYNSGWRKKRHIWLMSLSANLYCSIMHKFNG